LVALAYDFMEQNQQFECFIACDEKRFSVNKGVKAINRRLWYTQKWLSMS